MKKTPRKMGEFAASAHHFEEGLARICHLYGISPLIGRLYAQLFLSPEPLSLEALTLRVGAAKSTVSVALRKLLSARVARRLPPRGDRRDFYEAVTDPWAALNDWSRIFIQPELAMWREAGAELDLALASAKDAPKGADNAELRRRVATLTGFTAIFDDLLRTLETQRPARAPARTIAIRVEDDDR